MGPRIKPSIHFYRVRGIKLSNLMNQLIACDFGLRRVHYQSKDSLRLRAILYADKRIAVAIEAVQPHHGNILRMWQVIYFCREIRSGARSWETDNGDAHGVIRHKKPFPITGQYRR